MKRTTSSSLRTKTIDVSVPKSSFDLALTLVGLARHAKIQKLEKSEIKDLRKNDFPKANYYKLLATIDLDKQENVVLHESIMLLVDAFAHTESFEKHPEVVVAGEDRKHAEIQLVAEKKESLEQLHYDNAEKYLKGLQKATVK